MIREIYNTYEGGTNMKNRAFRIFAFTLAVMLIFVSYPTSASAAVECAHKNKTFDHYSYEYVQSSESYHREYRWAWYICADCNHAVAFQIGSSLKAHTFGSPVGTGNHHHSGKFHIYETVSTCTSCKYRKYGEVSYRCGGDGINCPVIII